MTEHISSQQFRALQAKRCSKCAVVKDRSAFHRKNKAKDGLNPSCRECVSSHTRLFYVANADRLKAKAVQYFQKNREVAVLQRKKYYQKNSEAAKKKSKLWAAANPEKRKEIASASAEKNREKKNKKSAESQRLKRLMNPELAREQGRRATALRRARVTGAGGAISTEWWDALFNVFETGVCLYCGEFGKKLVMDHWIPVSKGGPTEVGNLVPCCSSCNSSKHDKSPSDWKAIMAKRYGPREGATIEDFLAASREACEEFA